MKIQFRKVSKCYGAQRVIDRLSWCVQEGERWTVRGPSGIGKTTLLRLLMGLEPCTSGLIERTASMRFAAVFQENRLLPYLTAEQNIRLVCTHSLPEQVVRQALQELMGEADWTKPVQAYSGGMQRRVALARAVLAPADIIVLDEPFSGLDPESTDRAIHFTEKRLAGRGLVWVSHERESAFADSKVLLLPRNPGILPVSE